MQNLMMLMMLAVENAETNDSRNIVLWIIVCAIALVLLIGCAVISAVAKKREQGNDEKDTKKDDASNS